MMVVQTEQNSLYYRTELTNTCMSLGEAINAAWPPEDSGLKTTQAKVDHHLPPTAPFKLDRT